MLVNADQSSPVESGPPPDEVIHPTSDAWYPGKYLQLALAAVSGGRAASSSEEVRLLEAPRAAQHILSAIKQGEST